MTFYKVLRWKRAFRNAFHVIIVYFQLKHLYKLMRLSCSNFKLFFCDRRLRGLTCKRKCRRWPYAVFFEHGRCRNQQWKHCVQSNEWNEWKKGKATLPFLQKSGMPVSGRKHSPSPSATKWFANEHTKCDEVSRLWSWNREIDPTEKQAEQKQAMCLLWRQERQKTFSLLPCLSTT